MTKAKTALAQYSKLVERKSMKSKKRPAPPLQVLTEEEYAALIRLAAFVRDHKDEFEKGSLTDESLTVITEYLVRQKR